jgi:Concanavalin A-like lectin/glucanases superfamily
MDANGMQQLIDDYLDGSADESEMAQLKAWLEADASNLELFAREVFFHQQLRESLLADNSARFLESSSNPAATDAASKPIRFPQGLGTEGFTWSWSSRMLFLVIIFALASSSYLAFQFGWKRGISNARPTEHSVAIGDDAPYVAKLVKVTNCLWDSTRSTADLRRDSQICSGQSLYLLEGVAEIHSELFDGKVGKFILEGPVGLMMTSQGVPSLQYGKLSITINGESDFFALITSLGRVIASHDASFGIMSYGNKIELHVFSGDVTFDPLQSFSLGGPEEKLRVLAGTSLKLSLSRESTIAVQRGLAKEESFITEVSRNESRLNISEAYVAAIKQAHPIAYWRFDRLEGDLVPNEMSDQFACRVQGTIGWRTYPSGNRTAEFGVSTQSGSLLSDETLQDVLKDHYSIEFWVKPSYCQLGSMVSLVKYNPNNPKSPPLHGVIVELIGPASDPGNSSTHVDHIRFLHRSPPGMNLSSGTSCYSNLPYAPRIWQHVVAMKDGDSMKLFLNGKQVAEGTDTSGAPEGLRVMMGQLYSLTEPNMAVRPFVGELGEVALYDHSLTPAEIKKHVVLALTESTNNNSW